MKVVTLLNEKGGCGKTTLATHIAAGLAVRGKRVLLMDADPQGHCAYYFGIRPRGHYYRLLAENADWPEVIEDIPPEVYEPPGKQAQGWLKLVAGNNSSRNIERDVEYASELDDRLARVRTVTDVVIIDTPPTPSLAMSLVYMASDAIIYPTELASLSLQSLINSIETRRQMNNVRNVPIEALGIVPMKVRMNTVEHQENLKLLEAEFGELVWHGTTLTITFEEAAGQHRTAFAYAPESRAASEMWRIVSQIEKAIEALEHEQE